VLCRIYKKGNTQRSHERDDSIDDMIGEVPPSINVGHMSARFHLSRMSTSYSGALLENDRNTLEGVVIGNGSVNGISNTNNITSVISSSHQFGTSNSKAELLPFVPSNNTSNSASKRTLSSLYWNVDDHKHFNLDSNGNVSVLRTDQENNNNNNGTSGSFATLLNQLPQTPSLPQIDGLLRTPYQIQGTNWYG